MRCPAQILFVRRFLGKPARKRIFLCFCEDLTTLSVHEKALALQILFFFSIVSSDVTKGRTEIFKFDAQRIICGCGAPYATRPCFVLKTSAVSFILIRYCSLIIQNV